MLKSHDSVFALHKFWRFQNFKILTPAIKRPIQEAGDMTEAHLQEARGILLSGALVACVLLVAGAPAKYLSVHAILHISAHFKPTPQF